MASPIPDDAPVINAILFVILCMFGVQINQKYEYLNKHVIIGASGSLFGLLGGFGMLFPNRELYLYFFIPIKAKWLVILYGGFEIFSGLQNNPTDKVAHFAHIGGLLVGIALVLFWRKDRNHFY